MRFNRQAFEALLIRELGLLGMTAAAWARSLGISPGTLHEIRFPKEGRQQSPSAAMVRKLADGLGVPIGAIATTPAAAVAS